MNHCIWLNGSDKQNNLQIQTILNYKHTLSQQFKPIIMTYLSKSLKLKWTKLAVHIKLSTRKESC
jgi:hypothetical protein